MPRTNRRNPNQRRRARAAIEGLECRTLLATFVPNSFLDEIDLTPGNGVVDTTSGNITLRAAIMEANALAGADTITLNPGTYGLSIAGGFEDGGLTGDIDISDDLVIEGAFAANTIVDGNAVDRIFQVLAGASVKMSNITITDGFVRGDPNSNSGWSGGGVTNNGTLEMTDCVVTGNFANAPSRSGDGGGIMNGGGTLTLLRVTISSNTAADTGGGVRSHEANAVATFIDCTIADNVSFSGAGLSNTGGSQMEVTTSTISGNNATNSIGGGLRSENTGSTLTITRSIVSGNTANSGGGIGNIAGSETHVIETMISGNHGIAASQTGGGGIYNTGGPIFIVRSMISGNDTSAGGGGIRSNGALASASVLESTISGNSGSNGGGINNAGGSTMTVVNTTISANQGTTAGGIYNTATGTTITVTNVTMTGNIRNFDTTPIPGDIDNVNGGTFNIQNSISVSGVGSAGNSAVLNSLGNNIFMNTANGSGYHASDQLEVNPMLGPLASNGGPTQTHALLPGSPAINAANTAAAPAIDQRGAPRPTGAQADIGAYEVDGVQPSIVGSSFAFEAGHSFTIQFSENVSEGLVIGDLLIRPVLAGGALGSGITIQSYSYDVDTQTGTFVLPLLADGNYRATLNAGDVADISGNLLTTGLSADFFVLAGDANRDRSVNLHDLMALAANWMGTGKTFSQADFDYDGDVDAHDLGILASKWQQKLDAPLPSAPVNTAPATRAAARKPSRMVDQVGLTS